MRGRWTAGLILAAALGLAACQKRAPDFTHVIPSSDGQHSITLKGFEPRGTIDGQLVLFVSHGRKTDSETATFGHVTNGMVGWTSDGKIAVVGDHVDYRGANSDYTPEGTVQSDVRLVVCSRDDMDCSSLESRIMKAPSSRRLTRFPLRSFGG